MSDATKTYLMNFTKLRDAGLSHRECEVISWIVEGKRDAEIGVILGISVRTVNQHVRTILRKTSAETRTAAAAWSIQRAALPVSSS